MNQTQVAALIAELNAMPAGLYSCDASGSACTSYVAQWKVVELVEKHVALALRPAVEPMTREQIWHSNGIMSVNAELGWHMDDIVRVARAVEAHHGITAKAEGGAP